jgi:hypothetical protein
MPWQIKCHHGLIKQSSLEACSTMLTPAFLKIRQIFVATFCLRVAENP